MAEGNSDVVDDSTDSTSMEKTTPESLQSDSPSVISLLDRLRSPTSADLARKRQLKQNPPPKGHLGVKRGKGKEKGDPKNISATERVKTYPNVMLQYNLVQVTNLCLHFNYSSYAKKKQNVSKMGEWKCKIGRFIKQKSKAK